MTRPSLRQIPLAEVLPLGSGAGGLVMTMSRDQWDALLAESYAAGDVLLEVNAAGEPVAAFQKAGTAAQGRAS